MQKIKLTDPVALKYSWYKNPEIWLAESSLSWEHFGLFNTKFREGNDKIFRNNIGFWPFWTQFAHFGAKKTFLKKPGSTSF